MQLKTPELLFKEATDLIHQNLYIDAIKKYLDIADNFPENALADDALFNAGLCYFSMHLFTNAITTFNDVIEKYPQGDIYTTDGNEFGKIAAKCHYALLNCYLGIADLNSAKNEMNKLNNYPGSYTLTALGEKITFIELSEKALASYLKLTT